MTPTEIQIRKLQEELDWLMQSEAIRSMAEKDEKGCHKYDIRGLDRCIKTLHARLKEAEKKAQEFQAEAVLYRRKIEAMMDDQDVKTYPVHDSPTPVIARSVSDVAIRLSPVSQPPLAPPLGELSTAPAPVTERASNLGPILTTEGGPIL